MPNVSYTDEELRIYNGLAGFAYRINFTSLEPECTLEKMVRIRDFAAFPDLAEDVSYYAARHDGHMAEAHILPTRNGFKSLVFTADGTTHAGSTIVSLEEIEKGERDVDPGLVGDDFWHKVPIKGLPGHLALYVDIPSKADMEFNDLTKAEIKGQKWRMYLVDAHFAEVWTKEIDALRRNATELVTGLLPVFERGMSVEEGLQFYVELRSKIMPQQTSLVD